jgi:putative addiction module CopG family antidote
MNITLSPDSEQYLREQLAAGKFPTADAVVSEALRRMRKYDAKWMNFAATLPWALCRPIKASPWISTNQLSSA